MFSMSCWRSMGYPAYKNLSQLLVYEMRKFLLMLYQPRENEACGSWFVKEKHELVCMWVVWEFLSIILLVLITCLLLPMSIYLWPFYPYPVILWNLLFAFLSLDDTNLSFPVSHLLGVFSAVCLCWSNFYNYAAISKNLCCLSLRVHRCKMQLGSCSQRRLIQEVQSHHDPLLSTVHESETWYWLHLSSRSLVSFSPSVALFLLWLLAGCFSIQGIQEVSLCIEDGTIVLCNDFWCLYLFHLFEANKHKDHTAVCTIA